MCRAVLYFTGEALIDEEDYDEGDEADEDEEDEEDEDEDFDPSAKPQSDRKRGGNKANSKENPQECKQQ